MRFPHNTVFQLLLTTAVSVSSGLLISSTALAELKNSPAASSSASPAPLVISTYQPTNGESWYAVAMKPENVGFASVRQHIILVDTSASQTGRILESSLKLTQGLANQFSPSSRLQILAVDTDCSSMTDGFVATGSEGVKAGIQKLSLRTPLGATNLKSAFEWILSQKYSEPVSVVYIGDGMSAGQTVLTADLQTIVGQMADRQISMHSVILGPALDQAIPAAVANLTGGTLHRLTFGQEMQVAAGTAAALSIAPKHVKNIMIDGRPLAETRQSAIFLRPDRHAVVPGKGNPEHFQHLTASTVQGHTYRWSADACQRVAAGAELKQLVQQVEASAGLQTSSICSLEDLQGLRQQFADSMRQTVDAIEYLERRGRHREARKFLQQAAALDAGNPRLQAMLTGLGQPPLQGDDVPAPAPLPGDEFPVPAPGAALNPAPVPAADPDLPAPTQGQLPRTNPIADDIAPLPGAAPIDPVTEVEAAIQLQTQILVSETDRAISEAAELMFDQPDLAEGMLKDALETVRASVQISPVVQSQLEDRIVSALIGVTNLRQVNALKQRQIARDEAVKEAQAAALQEERLEEERLAILIDQVRGLLDRGRHGDRNGFEDGEAVARAALDLRPGDGTATQALVMSESLGQLDKAYRLVNLRHDRFLEVLYQVELSHVPFPDEPPIQYPPPDVWRALTLTRKPRYEAFDLRIEAPNEKWLRQMLDKPIPPLDFPGETPLSEILETIRAYYNTTYGIDSGLSGGDGRMTIYPDYKELELEGISSLEEVLIKDISFDGLTLRNALQLIFEQTSDPAELTYVIENEVFKVTTVAKATSEDNLVTRVYPVGDLVIPPVDMGGGMMGGGMGGMGGGMGGMGGMGGGMGGMGGGMGGMGGGMGGMGGGFMSLPPEILHQMQNAKQHGISTDSVQGLKKKPTRQ